MINICTVSDRRWQIGTMGYGFQTHSLAELISAPVRVKPLPFCQCRATVSSQKYRVARLGIAGVCQVNALDCCEQCGHAAFWSSKYEPASQELIDKWEAAREEKKQRKKLMQKMQREIGEKKKELSDSDWEIVKKLREVRRRIDHWPKEDLEKLFFSKEAYNNEAFVFLYKWMVTDKRPLETIILEYRKKHGNN